MRLIAAIVCTGMIAGALAAPPKPVDTGANPLHDWAVKMGTDYGSVELGWEFQGVAIRLDAPGVAIDGELGDGIWWVAAQPCPGVEPMVLMEGGLGVTCGAGFYACCYCVTKLNGEPCPIARCRQNGTPEPNVGCQAGGFGATSCEISLSECP